MTGKVFTLTGPTCSGKTTLARALVDSGEFIEIVGTTSRNKREGEIYGVDYYFVSKEEFELLRDNGEMLEVNVFNDNYYGTSYEELNRVFKLGKTPLVILDPNGVKSFTNIKDISCYSIYLNATIEILVERFLTRFKDNSCADIQYETKRLINMQKEHTNWWLQVSYDKSITSFTSENSDSIIRQLVDLSKSFKK